MPKNYTLSGVGSSVELGVGGNRFRTSTSFLQARDNADAAFVEGQGADATVDDSWVTLRQLNNAQIGLSWKEPVRAASTVDVTIATPGNVMDGVTLATGDRVLLKNQTNPVENGIYVFDTGLTPLVRATDMATGSDATNAALFVSEGTTQADQAYVETADPAVVGTDSLVFQQFASVTAGVTSIASVDNGGGAGTFASLVASGSPPTPTIRSISNGTQIAAVVSTNEVVLSIVAGSVGTTELADDGVTEPKLAAGVANLYRYIQLLAAGWPATTGSNTVNIGSVLPANSIVQGGKLLVTAAFNNSPDLEIGDASNVDAVFETTDVNLASADVYVSDRMAVYTASTQLIATRTTGAAQPTAGVVEVLVNFARVA